MTQNAPSATSAVITLLDMVPPTSASGAATR